MNKIFFIITGLLFVLGACVDDYTDYNPPHKLDAPTLRMTSAGTNANLYTVEVNKFQNSFASYAGANGPTVYTVSVIDAPGKIGDISVSISVPEFGSVELDEASANALRGKETGEFKFTFTPNSSLPADDDRSLNIVVSVSDTQSDEDGEFEPLTTTLTLSTTLVKCATTGIKGTYTVTAASGNIDGGTAYTLADLEDVLGDVEVVIEEVQPGRFKFSDVTGGVWPAFYSGRAAAIGVVDLCVTTLEGHEGLLTAGTDPGPFRTFTVDGTLNANGTIDITWSYQRDDAPTPTDPAKGTYTLTKI